MKVLTYRYGSTPRKRIVQRVNGERFPMTLSGSDEPIFVRAFNQGIDSHLEAFTDTKVSRESGNVVGNRLVVDMGPGDVPVLLRRLLEMYQNCECGFDEECTCGGLEALSLRDGILTTLDIEEV